MKTIYEKYMASPIDKELLCLEHGEITEPYFCYPVNAEPIGFEGCILYCFLPEYGEMVFACDPESCADRNVYPLAKNFEDFLRLILACGTADPVEQIVWMDKRQYSSFNAKWICCQWKPRLNMSRRSKKTLMTVKYSTAMNITR